MNLIREIHDAVADSDDLAEASVRPPGTTRRELEAMRHDVLSKLQVRSDANVLEIGCGIALLGVPVARASARYVGLDFSAAAVRRANERLAATGLSDRAHAELCDVLALGDDEVSALGRFDRVLMYAVLHYARRERDAVTFLQRAVGALRPGGQALIGSVPLEDLQADWPADEQTAGSGLARRVSLLRWGSRRGTSAVPLNRRWKGRWIVESALKRRSAGASFTPARLPSRYTIAITTDAVERWLEALGGEYAYHWELPRPGVPLTRARADLIVIRR